METGLIGLSGKPLHLGHWSLIERAAKENDRVLLFVSTTDRMRKGQITILGSDMHEIWKKYLIPILPSNIEITLGGVPIRLIWEALGEANEGGSKDTFRIYSDPEDLAKRFGDDKLDKYVPELNATGQIEGVPISREGGVDISGTQMREFLANNEKEQFLRYLPPVDPKAGEAIWNLLRSRLSESLLRDYISLIV